MLQEVGLTESIKIIATSISINNYITYYADFEMALNRII